MSWMRSLTKKITRQRLNEFLREQATDAKTLEIGSVGHNSATLFPNVVTTNISESSKVDVLGDAQNLPFKDESFEVILCTEVLEHLKKPQLAVDEMKRVLKKGGKLILTASLSTIGLAPIPVFSKAETMPSI